MSCEQSGQINVEAFVLDSRGVEFSSFRSHYPGCAKCAAEVARWTSFGLAVHDVLDVDRVGTTVHPEPERLEAFLMSRESIGAEAMTIEKHLVTCMSCQTEMRVLAQFETGFLPAVARVATGQRESAATVGNSLLDGLRGFVESLFLDVRSAVPVFAVVCLAILGIWLSGVFDRFVDAGPTGEGPQIVQERSPSTPAPTPTPAPDAGGGTPDPTRLAGSDLIDVPAHEERGMSRGAEQPVLKAPPVESVQIAQRPPTPDAIPVPESDPVQERVAESVPDEILLAALTELPLPDYAAPHGAESIGWMRQFGAVRAGPTVAQVETLAPSDHVGLTLLASPRLWWNLSADVDLPVQISVVDDRKLDPIFRMDLPGPHKAGLHSIDLAKSGIELEPGVEYRWFVSLVVDADRPSRNPIAAGALRRIPDSDERRQQVLSSVPSERGHTLARLGLWYDAYDFFASLAVAHPGFEPVLRHREHLVELAHSRL